MNICDTPLRRLLGVMAVLLAFVSCSTTDYRYRPADSRSPYIAGDTGAIYHIPLKEPRGKVQVASAGVVNLDDQEKITARTGLEKALQIRMAVSNESTKDWTIDTRDLIVSFDGLLEFAPAWVNSGQAKDAGVTVSPGKTEVVDLYYRLPPQMQKASELPQFRFQWKVNTLEEVVAETTPFERIRIESEPRLVPDRAGVGAGYPPGYIPGFGVRPSSGLGWGPYWWGI